jgi:hypothetical protein
MIEKLTYIEEHWNNQETIHAPTRKKITETINELIDQSNRQENQIEIINNRIANLVDSLN